MFVLGGALVYYLIMPLAIKFFLSFETTGQFGSLPIQLEAKVNEYLSLIMRLIFAFGISFQLPVLLTLLAKVGFIDSAYLKKRRRYVIVIIFAAAALLNNKMDTTDKTIVVMISGGNIDNSLFSKIVME